MGILDGLGKFLADNRGEGNFTQRLGLAGAQLQDIDDGGNRAAPLLAQQQRARLSQEQVQQAQYLDELGQRIGLSPRERLLMRVSPEKAAEVLAKKLDPYTLSEGQGRYVPGEEDQTQFQPRTIESGDQFFQTQQGGGLNPVRTRDPSFQEQTNRQQVEANANRPVQVTNGGQVYDPVSQRVVANNPKTFAPPRAKAANDLEGMTTEQLIELAKSMK